MHRQPPRKWFFATLTYDQEDFSLHLQSNISVSFRDCVPGEIRRLDCCEACFSGNFSFSPEDLEFLLFASRVLSWRQRAPCRSRVLERQYFRTSGVSIPCYLRAAFSPSLSSALHAVLYVSSWLVPDLPLVCLGSRKQS